MPSRSLIVGLFALAFHCSVLPSVLSDMYGEWYGETTSAYYKIRYKIPAHYEVQNASFLVRRNGVLAGKVANGCLINGVIMRSTSSQYPIRGFISACPVKELNGAFEGMFNSSGQLRMVVKDKMLGRADFYGVLKRGMRIVD